MSDEPEQEKTPPKIVIRAPRPAEPAVPSGEPAREAGPVEPVAAAVERGRTPAGLVLAALGGGIASFAPLLLPWWKQTLNLEPGSQIDISGLVSLESQTFRGLQAWPGIVAFALGIAVLIAAIVMATRSDVSLQLNLASGMMVAGAVVAVACAYGIVKGSDLVGEGDFVVKTLAGPYVTFVGGVVAGIGGYLLMRNAQARGG